MKNLLTLTVCFVFIFTIVGFMPVHGEAEVYDSVVRLHVLANSDSEEDQALKLKVRDATLELSSQLMSSATSRDEAVEMISRNLDSIEDAARQVIAEEGFDYPVSVAVMEEEYPTRRYEAMCFPAGSYASLKIMIGKAEGQNWWCVLFPPLCTSAAIEESSPEDAFISVGFTQEQYKIITETDETKYEVRFKLLESIESARSSVKNYFDKDQ